MKKKKYMSMQEELAARKAASEHTTKEGLEARVADAIGAARDVPETSLMRSIDRRMIGPEGISSAADRNGIRCRSIWRSEAVTRQQERRLSQLPFSYSS